ncbi:hypothetical protein DdX_03348 [Ditylenchus destructor]|uniref:Secreted protein n=1 Tax=Ditylenchus destructor TaxID=166010 RepID=A0AAD4NJ23_9BILA|nr:hypothetical protein DdX_03348 [Ditylenchus destructor]
MYIYLLLTLGRLCLCAHSDRPPTCILRGLSAGAVRHVVDLPPYTDPNLSKFSLCPPKDPSNFLFSTVGAGLRALYGKKFVALSALPTTLMCYLRK